MRLRSLVFLLLSAAIVAAMACGKKKPAVAPEPAVAEVVADAGPDVQEDVAPPPTLYDRIGGAEVLKVVVDKLIENVTQDPAVNKAFKATKGPKLDAFKKNLTDQLCEVAGGPCNYGGKDMKAAHKGMKLNDAQFEAFVTDLKYALAEAKVAEAEQQELVEKLTPLREDVVEVKPKAKK
jgi:hemoglobin